MRFVAPEADAYLPSDPVAVWKNLTEKLIVETVPGNHLKMVAEHSEKLAAVLSRYVRGASEGYS
jgi:thioesterase domain-containing protein